MCRRSVALVLVALACLGLTGCGSSGPSSVDDLVDLIEDAGNACPNESFEDGPSEAVMCDEGVNGAWYESTAVAAQKRDEQEDLFGRMPFKIYYVYGNQWTVSSNESGKEAVYEVADSLNMDVTILGN